MLGAVDPRLRTTLVGTIAVVLAIYLGAQVAQGFLFWPAVCGTIILASVLVRLTGLAADTIFLGLVLIGYIVGNRGFAQLMPAPGVPLLPAEAALLLGCSWRLIQWAFQRELPFRRDTLNWTVLALMVAGTVRAGFDVPRFGFNAVRDYATIYYASFFFLVQHMASRPEARRYLIGCLVAAIVILCPVYTLYQLFEPFFLRQLVVAGTPLVFYKGDLVAIHFAVGSLLLFHWARGGQRYWAWPISGAVVLFLLAYDSRAALLGATVGGGLLLLAGRWRYPAANGAVAACALLAVLVLSVVFGNTWAERKIDALTERAASFVDVGGARRYASEDSRAKGDNNRFRLVWWRNVIEETTQTNPVFGLGFGADLARGFVQEYFPETGEEFSTRSPHNIFVTYYGRMGAVGVALWGAFCVVFFLRTWHCLRRTADPVTWSLWCGGWVILVSGCFGVVLEGPMGAVIFWTLLGLANSTPEPADQAAPAEIAAEARTPAAVGA